MEEQIIALVEIPRGSRNKYEYDDRLRSFRLDRVLYSSVHYPTDYGFIPETLAPDGDHLDVLIIVQEPTFPGCLVAIRPVGVLDMIDEKGHDQKILAVPLGDPRYSEVHDIDDLNPHWLKEIEQFFDTYKILQNLETVILGWNHHEEAFKIIREYRERYRKGMGHTSD